MISAGQLDRIRPIFLDSVLVALALIVLGRVKFGLVFETISGAPFEGREILLAGLDKCSLACERQVKLSLWRKDVQPHSLDLPSRRISGFAFPESLVTKCILTRWTVLARTVTVYSITTQGSRQRACGAPSDGSLRTRIVPHGELPRPTHSLSIG